VIHHGRTLFDGELARLKEQFTAYQTVSVRLDSNVADLSTYGDLIGRDGGKVLLRMPKAETSRMTARLLNDHPVTELTIEDPPVEEVIERVFADALAREAATSELEAAS